MSRIEVAYMARRPDVQMFGERGLVKRLAWLHVFAAFCSHIPVCKRCEYPIVHVINGQRSVKTSDNYMSVVPHFVSPMAATTSRVNSCRVQVRGTDNMSGCSFEVGFADGDDTRTCWAVAAAARGAAPAAPGPRAAAAAGTRAFPKSTAMGAVPAMTSTRKLQGTNQYDVHIYFCVLGPP